MSLVTVADGPALGVRVLTLRDPDHRNAISPRFQADLGQAVDAVAADDAARVLVVAAEGSAFCAGADLPAVFGDTTRSVATLRDDLRRVYDSFLRVRRLSIPTIAAVNGPAIGAGMNLALCCDLRYAGPRASFGVTFSRLGLHPGGGCTQFLVETVGAQRTFELVLDGAMISAAEAVELGLVLRIVDDPLAAALESAARYAALDPQLTADVKRCIDIARGGNLDQVIDFEAWAQASSATKPQLLEAVAKFSPKF